MAQRVKRWYTKTDMMALGRAIRSLRTLRRAKIKRIADEVGISVQVMFNYENGRSVPNFLVLMKIVKAIGFDVATFEREYIRHKRQLALIEMRAKRMESGE